jgi:hypothetical protein
VNDAAVEVIAQTILEELAAAQEMSGSMEYLQVGSSRAAFRIIRSCAQIDSIQSATSFKMTPFHALGNTECINKIVEDMQAHRSAKDSVTSLKKEIKQLQVS